jgi:hypothetical protein
MNNGNFYDFWHRLEVKLYIEAITGAIDKLDEIPISTRLIKQIHQTLLSSGRGVEKMLLTCINF